MTWGTRIRLTRNELVRGVDHAPLVLVDEVDHFEKEVAGGLEGLRADLVEGVFGGVVVAVGVGGVVGAVVVVDDVEDGDAALVEGNGVVFDGGVVGGEGGGVAGVPGGLDEERPELGGGVGVVVDVEVLVADHVGEEEGLDVGEGAVLGPLGGEVAGAVEGVLRGPGFDGFFAVVEEQIDAVALGWVGAEVLADSMSRAVVQAPSLAPTKGMSLRG